MNKEDLKFICKKVKEIKFYHKVISWLAYTFLKVNLFYCTEEILKKELNKKKRMLKNMKRLIKDPYSEKTEVQFKKAYEKLDKWQIEIDTMEEELKR